ncbi:MAG: tetratricopeptide repeat protein [Microcystis flos-aquae TF09]|uniref:Tetratricopeptide repeat protein n=1 Tax=Microcystis flos-aquae TF09 TaxID=2060473 RepID=A0A3E0KUT0_9CHRO|nr:MAG: tetratricopeptide repeat protein [Microcystis flos-aquae TF09]
MEWLVLWGAKQLAGFAFGAVLENLGTVLGDLTKGAGEDFVKDFFKDSLKSGIRRFQKDALAVVMGKAIAQFLYLVQQELEASGMRKADLQKYNPALQKFIRHKAVKSWLSKAFEPGCQALDGKSLRAVWSEMQLPDLPEEFSWGKIGRVYLNRVEDMIGESQELKELFATKQLVDINQTTQQLAGVVPDFDLERYCESLRDIYDRLKLNAVDITYSQYKVRLWSIFVPQNVREALPPSRYEFPKRLEQKPENVSPDEWEQYRQLFLEKPVHPVLEILRDPDCPYAVILGDPGAGKSSLLQYLALDWAENPTAQIPLLIELRQYVTDENKPKDFLEFFHQGKRKICELNQLQLHEQLELGNALVMFDGLDEIFDAHIRDGVITEIIAFTNKYKRARVIVTSRIIGYNSGRLENAEFRHFTLEDLNDSQIRDFVQKWHRLALVDETDHERSEIRKRLQTAIKDSTAIRELAGNPLLLTMMAILNRKQELPRKRADLYEESSKVLLHHWDIDYKKMQLTLDDVDLRAKQAMLRRVAFYMQSSQEGLKGNLIHRDALEAELTAYLRSREIPNPLKVAGKLIDQLRQRDFIICHVGNDYFGFVHRTFLEYFCATEFADRFSKRGTEGGLTLEQLQREVFESHWQDKSWHEVLRLIIGNEKIDAEFAGAIVSYLIDIQADNDSVSLLLLAADCYAEISGKTKIPAVSEQLLHKLKTAVEENKKPQPITQKMITLWKDSAEVKAWLEERALNHKNSSVRKAIAQGIAAVELSDLTSLEILVNNLGDLYYWQNRYEEAIAVYLKLNTSTTFFSQSNLLSAYTILKRYDEAIAYGQQCIEKEPKSHWAYNDLGDAYREAGRYDEAIAACNRAIELAGNSSWVAIFPLQRLGRTYHDRGQYESAIATYKRAIAIDSKSQFNSSTHSDLGMVHHALGRYQEAMAAYQQAMVIDATNGRPHNDLGCLYRELEQWEDAITSFQTAIELNPRYSLPYRNLGILFLLQGDLDRAEPNFTTALQINPYHCNGILSMGLLQAMRGDLTAARATWEQGLQLYGEYGQFERIYRTLYTVALGQAEPGIANLRRILKQEKPPSGLLRPVLEIARLLQRCPEPIDRISQVVVMLESGIQPRSSS